MRFFFENTFHVLDVAFATNIAATFTGTSGDDTANAGNGTLTGFTGGTVAQLQDATGDTFLLGDGSDSVVAGSGNDAFVFANAGFATGKSIDGGAGTDTIAWTATDFDPHLDLSQGNIVNVETLQIGDIFQPFGARVTMSATQWASFSSITVIDAGDVFARTVLGAGDISGIATLPTETPVLNFLLRGTSGNDNFTARGAQLDAIVSGSQSGNIDFGDGTDTLNLTSTSARLNSLGNSDINNLEQISFALASSGIELNLRSQSEAFTITGSSHNDSIQGGAGADTIFAGDGDDTINWTAGSDNDALLDGEDGNDTLQTVFNTSFNDTGDGQIINVENVLLGTAATLVLDDQTEGFNFTGSAFNDAITAGSGADTIAAGAGNDTLTGGGGADTFRFAELGATNSDTITDYNFAQGDRIDVSALLDANFVSGSSNDGDFVRLQEFASSVIVQVDTDGALNGANWQDVASISNYDTPGNQVAVYFENQTHTLTL